MEHIFTFLDHFEAYKLPKFYDLVDNIWWPATFLYSPNSLNDP